MEMFQSNRQRRLSQVVFGVYLVLLVWLILGKLTLDLWNLPSIRSINLIPFGASVVVNGKLDLSEIFYNLLAFVPMGVCVAMFRDAWPRWKQVLPALGFSLAMEAIQYALAIGASDITDVLTNTLGGVLGLGLFAALRKCLREKAVTAVNAIGLGVEGCAFALIALLTAANS